MTTPELLEIERTACRIASGLTGVPVEECQRIAAGAGPTATAVGAPDIDIAALIEMIIEILLMVSENCPMLNAQAIKEPSPYGRVWFRIVVRRVSRDYSVDLRVRDIADTIVTEFGQMPETVLAQVYQEATQPDFSVA